MGLADGSSDGELEGVQDGRDEGTSLGLELGSSDGDAEGLALGDADGNAEGLPLGLPDGDAVGDVDGNSVKLTDPCRLRAWRAQSCRTRRECRVLGRSWRLISESWLLSAVDVASRRRSRAVVVIVELAMMTVMLAQFERKVWLYVRFVRRNNELGL